MICRVGFSIAQLCPPRPPLWVRTTVLPPVSSVVLWGVARYPAGRWGAVCSLFGRLPPLAGSVLVGAAVARPPGLAVALARAQPPSVSYSSLVTGSFPSWDPGRNYRTPGVCVPLSLAGGAPLFAGATCEG